MVDGATTRRIRDGGLNRYLLEAHVAMDSLLEKKSDSLNVNDHTPKSRRHYYTQYDDMISFYFRLYLHCRTSILASSDFWTYPFPSAG